MSLYFIKNYTIKYTLYIIDKRLHYLPSEGDILYFLLDISAETDINPFDKKLLIDNQFISNKKPYITFKKDFFIPSLFDNRNFFDCLYKKDYIYDKIFDMVEKIFDEIVHKRIKHFLFCVKDCIEFKNFIFFDYYDLKEFYNMNDFLEKDNILLYRIN